MFQHNVALCRADQGTQVWHGLTYVAGINNVHRVNSDVAVGAGIPAKLHDRCIVCLLYQYALGFNAGVIRLDSIIADVVENVVEIATRVYLYPICLAKEGANLLVVGGIHTQGVDSAVKIYRIE